MLASILGAIAGKKSGGSAIKGALTGKAAAIAVRTLAPAVGAAAVGFAALKGWQKYNSNQETKDVADKSAAIGSAAVAQRDAE